LIVKSFVITVEKTFVATSGFVHTAEKNVTLQVAGWAMTTRIL
jgi:hypothetical protein